MKVNYKHTVQKMIKKEKLKKRLAKEKLKSKASKDGGEEDQDDMFEDVGSGDEVIEVGDNESMGEYEDIVQKIKSKGLDKSKNKGILKRQHGKEIKAKIAELKNQSKKLKKKDASQKSEKKKIAKQIKELKSLLSKNGGHVNYNSDAESSE
mmetsp:Transcript_2187/g.3814  ORF Transcript_2187/g.3814 Transcript_2187/m.3814 type:complete len:151 (-) Transcript_2187:48-500(-)